MAALFDRRLLAYFDNASLGVSRTTLQDRTVEYQQSLAEIEHELGKYQRLLGSQRVKLRPRNREGWVSAHRTAASVRERHAHSLPVASAPAQDRSPTTGRGSVAASEGHREAQRDGGSERQRRSGRSSGGSTASPRANAAAGRRRSSAGSAQGAAAVRASVEAAAAAAAEPVGAAVEAGVAGVELTTWAQLDSLTGLPLGAGARGYVVCGGWEGQEMQATKEEPAQEAGDGSEACVVRQQLRLPGGVGGRWVLLEVVHRSARGDELVGHCRLDALDAANHEIRTHALRGAGGEATGASFSLRLHQPEAAPAPAPAPEARRTVAAVCQDPRAVGPSTRSVALPQASAELAERSAPALGGGGGPADAGEPGADAESRGEELEEQEEGEDEDGEEDDEEDEEAEDDEDEEDDTEEPADSQEEEEGESEDSDRALPFDDDTAG